MVDRMKKVGLSGVLLFSFFCVSLSATNDKREKESDPVEWDCHAGYLQRLPM